MYLQTYLKLCLTYDSFRRGGTDLIKKETAGFIDGDFVQCSIDPDTTTGAEMDKYLKGTNFAEHVMSVKGGQEEKAGRSDVAGILEAVAGFH